MPTDASTISESYKLCRLITSRSKSSFRIGFRFLPRDQSDAMHALYAFCRLTDDIADGDLPDKSNELQAWQTLLIDAIKGAASQGIFPALIDSIQRFQINTQHLFDQIAGAQWDIEHRPIIQFHELEEYCHLVASSVGLACLSIWRCRDQEKAIAPAKAAGMALQMTNILRDLGEDRSRGRVYLPKEELETFDCPPERWAIHDPRFQKLMTFQIERIRNDLKQSQALIPLLPKPGRTVFQIFLARYRLILEEIERRKFDVFTRRVKPSRIRTLSAIGRIVLYG